ncbi:MAG TPA: endonuclease domain-containing protein, partial [Pirellulales bacterium]
MPLADLEKRRAYDRERGRERYRATRVVVTASCAVCGATLPPHNGRGRKRKICERPECRRKYKTQKQRIYGRSQETPEQAERRRTRERERSKQRLISNPDVNWAWNLKYFHGTYPEQWHAMFMEQRGCCYLCENPLPDDRKKVVIDHDHAHCPVGRSCGVCRRGLACSNCNTLIGLAQEDGHRL